jgi:MraZ protein
LSGFLGSYLYQVDEKGRITLPAAFRRGMDESTPFVLVQVHNEALTLYPHDNWVEVEARLREMAKRAPRARLDMLALTANAVEVTPDKQGRILIPDRLRERVGIQTEAQLVGALDKIEIWSPETFQSRVEDGGGEYGEMIAGLFA